MRRRVFGYLESDDNRLRRHSSLGVISPEAFEARMIAQAGVHQRWARSVSLTYRGVAWQ